MPTGLFNCDIRGAGFTDQQAARIFAAQDAVQWASMLTAIPPWHINGTIWVESRFNPLAVSATGAMGLMQLMTPTAREMAKHIGIDTVDFFNPRINVQLGSAYLKLLTMWAFRVNRSETFPKRAETHRRVVEALGFEPTDWQLAYGAYFGGPGGVQNPRRREKIVRYIHAVENAAARFKALESYCEGKPPWTAPAPKAVRPQRPRPVAPPTPPAVVAQDGGAGVLALLVIFALASERDVRRVVPSWL